MSLLTELMDRLTDISSLRVQVADLLVQQREVRGVMLLQQRELAEVRGQLKALLMIQGQTASKGRKG